jgi:hypothetical protein
MPYLVYILVDKHKDCTLTRHADKAPRHRQKPEDEGSGRGRRPTARARASESESEAAENE